MARGGVRVEYNDAVLKAIIRSPQGGVYRTIQRRAIAVRDQAKRNLSRNPSRIRTGRLRNSIYYRMQVQGQSVKAIVGFGTSYGALVHDGTGIYGPIGKPIRPRRKKFMSWKDSSGRWVRARVVRGMEPNPFLQDALNAAQMR